jgi:hypothetical protein
MWTLFHVDGCSHRNPSALGVMPIDTHSRTVIGWYPDGQPGSILAAGF